MSLELDGKRHFHILTIREMHNRTKQYGQRIGEFLLDHFHLEVTSSVMQRSIPQEPVSLLAESSCS